jgi:hypothetical protein
MINIFRSGANEHIKLSMWLRAFSQSKHNDAIIRGALYH